jgi:hypothetical protein
MPRPSDKIAAELSKEGKLPVRKIEAAVWQLETAIWLWSEDRDAVSVVTLAHAAHEILVQINRGRPTQRPSLSDGTSDMLTEEGKRIWPTLFKLDPNFAKHGGADASKVHYFAVKTIPFVLLDGIYIYAGLGYKPRAMFQSFMAWMWITHPTLFRTKFSELGIPESTRSMFEMEGKKWIFQTMLEIHSKTLARMGTPCV